jgi:hypothetical protein
MSMAHEQYSKLSTLLLELLQRDLYPNGYPEDLTEQEFTAALEAWLAKHSHNDAVQGLWDQMLAEHILEMLEDSVAQAAGFRSIVCPNADGTLSRHWTKHTPDGAVPEPNPEDPTRN